jgi:hypothetical protein
MDSEIVKIELLSPDKMMLSNQITTRMTMLGLGADINKLDLGFTLPENWPIDLNDQPTLAQLTVVARKLKMNIVISSIDLYPDGT